MSWWFLLIYLGAQLALGLWLSHRVSSETDFFIAGRRLGLPLLSVSLFATWFGAETCLGSSGAIYQEGLSGGRADPFGYSLCLLLMGVLLVRRLWQGELLTLGDLFRVKFNVTIERLAVIILLPSSLIWAAAQVKAFGQVISATMRVDVELAVYCSAAFVVLYTFLGGLLGDVITDFVQGGLLALGLLLLLGSAVDSVGGLNAAWQGVESARLTLLPSNESVWVQLDRFSIPIFGSLIAQELIARVLAAKSVSIARRASFTACGLYLVVGMAPVILGLMGPRLLPNLDDPEQLLPRLAEQLLPQALYALFSCALLSAILSTVDSILLASAALLSHNIAVPLLNLQTEKSKLLTGRIFVVLSGLIALVLALYTESVYALVETASAFGTAGVLVVTLAALYLPKAPPLAAGAALITGLIATPVLEYVVGVPAPFLGSITAAGLVYVSIGLWDARRKHSLPTAT